MNTIQLIGIYGVIGVVVSLGIDLLVQKFNPTSYQFGNGERIWMIIIWPIMILVFIYQFIKGYNQNK
jgi:ABC-type branched-subunit amino acid transport system permease subunit